MGGNLALKALGHHAAELPKQVCMGAAVNPAADLAACCFQLRSPMQRVYDRFFARGLAQRVAAREDLFGDLARQIAERPPNRIVEFDRRFTVPVWGFKSAKHYYDESSAIQYLNRIEVPTLILHSKDDPLIPGRLFETLATKPNVHVHLSDFGGHLGYYGRAGLDPDRWWVDWRIADWFEQLKQLRCHASDPDDAYLLNGASPSQRNDSSRSESSRSEPPRVILS
jgi:hypothetical protein